jgi:FAD/FMN-containing dehydrogenase
MATIVTRATEAHILLTNSKEAAQNIKGPRQSKAQIPAQTAGVDLQRHDRIVSRLASEVQHFAERGERFRINHGSSNSTRPTSTGNLLDISCLNNVLFISKGDPDHGFESWCLAEPNVPMDKLVEATIPHGLVPPVVMEFPGITVGGGFSGTSGESSSFRHGFFSDNVHEVEIILGDGQVVKASNENHPDLFHAAAGALGTLGIVTAVKMRLVPAKRFVHVRYTRLGSFPDAVSDLHKMKSGSFEYLDAILYSKHHGVAITGNPVDESMVPHATRIKTFSNAADDWFYRHVRDKTRHLSPGSDVDEYVPLAEFLFRYDRGGFWVGEMGYDYFKNLIPFNGFMRWLLDDFSHTRTLYHALHATGVTRELVVQDVTVPWDNAAALIDHISEDLEIWPLWLCPLAGAQMPTFHPMTTKAAVAGSGSSGTSDEMLSIGLWGWGPKKLDQFVAKNRGLEAKLEELRGRKWLYANMFYTEEEFWRLYDREWYEELRERYHATNLVSIYDKIRKSGVGARSWAQTITELWPVGGIFGMWRAVRSGDIKLHRNAKWKWLGGN